MNRDASGANSAMVICMAAMALVGLVNGVWVGFLARNYPPLFWLADFAHWVVLPTLLIWHLWRKHGIAPDQFGFARPIINLKWLAVVLAAAVTLDLVFVWSLRGARSVFGDIGQVFSLASAFPEGWLGSVAWGYSALTAGVVESAFCIGLPWLWWSRVKAGNGFQFACLASLVFAAMHWEQGVAALVGAFAYNLAACGWYFWARSLWPVVVGHVVVDLIAFG